MNAIQCRPPKITIHTHTLTYNEATSIIYMNEPKRKLKSLTSSYISAFLRIIHFGGKYYLCSLFAPREIDSSQSAASALHTTALYFFLLQPPDIKHTNLHTLYDIVFVCVCVYTVHVCIAVLKESMKRLARKGKQHTREKVVVMVQGGGKICRIPLAFPLRYAIHNVMPYRFEVSSVKCIMQYFGHSKTICASNCNVFRQLNSLLA